ncbi:hypothetical protein [Bacillus nitratireducens]|uniref:hypothetical protein n=1 Tax=Bacillus nitratireducens TaxID=2026193 RepID=UPI00283C54F3|nr:hypothetical protein [Bacillus nitratireducens]MDR4170370.1 hypothetical protein [Bacillus nitratireducens]
MVVKRVICIIPFATNGDSSWDSSTSKYKVTPGAGYVYGQTYELELDVANRYIADGLMIDYYTQLNNPKLPMRVKHNVIRIGVD